MIQEFSLSEIVGKDGVFVDGDWVESKDQDPNGNVRLIQLADIGDGYFVNKSNRFLTSKRAKELNCTFLKPGDLLIARMPDPLGRSCIFPILDMPCITVVDVCIVRPDKKKAITEWLKFMINSVDFRNSINKFITGTTRQRISRSNLDKLRFKLPPLQAQIRVANILGKAESLIIQRKESLRLVDEFLKSTFLEMFGDPVRNEKKLKLISLGELGVWKSGGTPSRSNASFFQGNIPWITSGELNQMYIDDANEKITPAAIESSNASKIQEGSLLLGMYDTAALKSSINRTIVTCNQAIAFSKLDSKMCHTLFVYFNIQIGKDYFRSQQRGVRQKNMNLSMIKGLKILSPSLKLQNKFAHIVEKTEALKTRYQTSLHELENLYGSLSQKAFTGELNRRS